MKFGPGHRWLASRLSWAYSFSQRVALLDVDQFFNIFFMQDRPKQGEKPLLIRGYKKKNIKDGNNSGELKAGINIPLKTV